MVMLNKHSHKEGEEKAPVWTVPGRSSAGVRAWMKWHLEATSSPLERCTVTLRTAAGTVWSVGPSKCRSLATPPPWRSRDPPRQSSAWAEMTSSDRPRRGSLPLLTARRSKVRHLSDAPASQQRPRVRPVSVVVRTFPADAAARPPCSRPCCGCWRALRHCLLLGVMMSSAAGAGPVDRAVSVSWSLTGTTEPAAVTTSHWIDRRRPLQSRLPVGRSPRCRSVGPTSTTSVQRRDQGAVIWRHVQPSQWSVIRRRNHHHHQARIALVPALRGRQSPECCLSSQRHAERRLPPVLPASSAARPLPLEHSALWRNRRRRRSCSRRRSRSRWSRTCQPQQALVHCYRPQQP